MSSISFFSEYKCPKRGDVKLTDVLPIETLSQKKLPVKLFTLADYGISDGCTLEMSPAVYTAESYRSELIEETKFEYNP